MNFHSSSLKPRSIRDFFMVSRSDKRKEDGGKTPFFQLSVFLKNSPFKVPPTTLSIPCKFEFNILQPIKLLDHSNTCDLYMSIEGH